MSNQVEDEKREKALESFELEVNQTMEVLETLAKRGYDYDFSEDLKEIIKERLT